MNHEIAEANRIKLINICKAYQTARPILNIAKKILFFKPKWAAVIGFLIVTLDEICET